VKKIRNLLVLIAVLCLGAGGVWGWFYLHRSTTLPIRYVKVVGDYQFISPDILQKVVIPYVSTGFFNVNIESADEALVQIPGVSRATLKRVWPDKVEIRVKEKTAQATLPDGSVYAMDGTVFQPILSPNLSQLPVFAGAVSDLPAIKNFYDSASFLLLKQGFQVTYVGCDGLGSWTLGVKHGVDDAVQASHMTIVLGQDHLLEKLTRFVQHYSMLEETNGGKIPVSVDLRYSLGFAAKYSQKVT
jgi:cell division protein FtsQ